MISASSASGSVLTASAALGPGLFHAHVERTFAAEGEAALGLVELHRRNAEVEGHAVDRGDAFAGQQRVHRAEAAFDHGEARPA